MTDEFLVINTTTYKRFWALSLHFKSKAECERSISSMRRCIRPTGEEPQRWEIADRKQVRIMLQDGVLLNICWMSWAWDDFLEKLNPKQEPVS